MRSPSLKRRWISVLSKTLLVVSPISFWGCRDIPAWQGKIFLGDPARQVVTRVDVVDGQEIRTDIPTSDPKFHGAIVFIGNDFESFWKTYVLSCKEWDEGGGPMIPMAQALSEYSLQQEQLAQSE